MTGDPTGGLVGPCFTLTVTTVDGQRRNRNSNRYIRKIQKFITCEHLRHQMFRQMPPKSSESPRPILHRSSGWVPLESKNLAINYRSINKITIAVHPTQGTRYRRVSGAAEASPDCGERGPSVSGYEKRQRSEKKEES